jgi:hypothetical protein
MVRINESSGEGHTYALGSRSRVVLFAGLASQGLHGAAGPATEYRPSTTIGATRSVARRCRIRVLARDGRYVLGRVCSSQGKGLRRSLHSLDAPVGTKLYVLSRAARRLVHACPVGVLELSPTRRSGAWRPQTYPVSPRGRGPERWRCWPMRRLLDRANMLTRTPQVDTGLRSWLVIRLSVLIRRHGSCCSLCRSRAATPSYWRVPFWCPRVSVEPATGSAVLTSRSGVRGRLQDGSETFSLCRTRPHASSASRLSRQTRSGT